MKDFNALKHHFIYGKDSPTLARAFPKQWRTRINEHCEKHHIEYDRNPLSWKVRGSEHSLGKEKTGVSGSPNAAHTIDEQLKKLKDSSTALSSVMREARRQSSNLLLRLPSLPHVSTTEPRRKGLDKTSKTNWIVKEPNVLSQFQPNPTSMIRSTTDEEHIKTLPMKIWRDNHYHLIIVSARLIALSSGLS